MDNLDEFFVDDSDEIRISTSSRKRDKKSGRKDKRKRQRRLSNSNLMIPTSDEESYSESVSNSSEQSDSEQERHCAICAGRHDHEDCQSNRKSNQKYSHYENVRNRFAKDVGFNYKRENNYKRYVEESLERE